MTQDKQTDRQARKQAVTEALNTARGMELNAIAAVIIGGTSLAGGQGTIIGTVIGVLIMGVLNNGIILLGISPFWQMTIVGAVIILAVAMDIWTRKSGRS